MDRLPATISEIEQHLEFQLSLLHLAYQGKPLPAAVAELDKLATERLTFVLQP